jgi:hypothetical protein
LVLSSCGSGKKGGQEEGVIEFETKGVDTEHPLYGFMPSSAVLKFKHEKFIIEMSTMGLFNTSIIGNTKEKTLAQTIKYMNVREACIEEGKDIDIENSDYPLKFEETDETKEIIGFECYKVKVTKVKEPNVSFDIWYTKDLGMENCNALTPYAPIKGVLINYRIKKMGMEMDFLAKSYKSEQIADNVFEVPASMKIVSKEHMTKFFNDLQ